MCAMDERTIDLVDQGFDFGSIGSVRRAVERHSARVGLSDPALYRFVVAVHEIVTNAVRHGGGRGRLRLWLEGHRLICRVTDAGTGIPDERRTPAPRPDPGTIGGWGLWLAREGCDMLTVDSGRAGGSVITLIRRIGGAPADPGRLTPAG
jgi:anti-sigma regulatory factor (Ser/Thr protein kinase)